MAARVVLAVLAARVANQVIIRHSISLLPFIFHLYILVQPGYQERRAPAEKAAMAAMQAMAETVLPSWRFIHPSTMVKLNLLLFTAHPELPALAVMAAVAVTVTWAPATPELPEIPAPPPASSYVRNPDKNTYLFNLIQTKKKYSIMPTIIITGEPYTSPAPNGGNGSTGTQGSPGTAGETCYRDSDCTYYCCSYPSNGGQGGQGTTGINGSAGAKGRPAPPTTLNLGIVTDNMIIRVGGGRGQDGGKGGSGGNGGPGGPAGALDPKGKCTPASQGPQGRGGTGGNGGKAGDGGDGTTVTVNYNRISGGSITPDIFLGDPGTPGGLGNGGSGNPSGANGNNGPSGAKGSTSQVNIRQVP